MRKVALSVKYRPVKRVSIWDRYSYAIVLAVLSGIFTIAFSIKF